MRISTFTHSNYMMRENVNLIEHDFALAFGVRHANSKEELHDPDLIEYVVSIITADSALV